MLPRFTEEGFLPPDDYEMTLSELRESVLVCGGEAHPHWDTDWRGTLIDGLEVLARQLWHVGVDKIFVDGSFVEDKDRPNDIDGYFVCGLRELVTGQLQDALNELDPFQVWTWEANARTPYPGFPKKQLPMWHRYRVELYPHFPGMGCGILDNNGHELEFPSAFRRSRISGRPKGIISLRRDPSRP